MIAYQQGDYSAFEELYRRHSGRVFGYLKKKIPDVREAEDLLQQVFMKFHHSRKSYNSDYPVLTWIFAICRNTIIDFFRKKKPVVVAIEKINLATDPSQETEDSFPIEQALIDESLKSLSLQEKKLLKMRFEEGLSFEQISNSLGASPVSLRKRMSRSLAKMRTIIGKKDGSQ